MVEGYKGIAAELERIWGRSVSEDAAWRYAHSDRDPLPAEETRGRVACADAELAAWAARNRRRVAPAPLGEAQLGLFGAAEVAASAASAGRKL